jgi:tetratricopeptide (TPR) repeat protein
MTSHAAVEAGGSSDPEARQRLEQERDFLLRSLDDLDAERAAGNVDDASYRALHDDYTSRAAAAIRSLRDDVDARPVPRPVSTRRRVLTIGGVVAFAVLSALGLAAALGARLPGETSSGNTGAPRREPAVTSQQRRDRLVAAVARDPNDVASRLLLARFLESDGDIAGALAQYDAVVGIDATNAEAEAQAGRLLYVAAGRVAPDEAAPLVERSRARLDRAIDLDPRYPDARFFRAIVLANEFEDFAAAQNDLQRYLVAAPEGLFAEQARQLLADVTQALEPAP